MDPNWKKEVETKVLEIARTSITGYQFRISLTGYCNYFGIAVNAPRPPEEHKYVMFYAIKKNKLGKKYGSLHMFDIKKEEFSNTFCGFP